MDTLYAKGIKLENGNTLQLYTICIKCTKIQIHRNFRKNLRTNLITITKQNIV